MDGEIYCPSCGAIDWYFVEERVPPIVFSSGIGEVDRLFGFDGSGFVPGLPASSSVLVAGEPGVGKTTFALRLAAEYAKRRRVLYVSSEQNADRLVSVCKRMGLNSSFLRLWFCGWLPDVTSRISEYRMVFVDSLNMMSSYGRVCGSATSIRYTAERLTAWADKNKSVVFLLCHVNRDGSISGPRFIEHLVDIVLMLSSHESGRKVSSSKNRFAPVKSFSCGFDEKGFVFDDK